MPDLRVMSFNMWHGGHAGGLPLSATAEVITAAGADVVGVQECSRFPPGSHPDSARIVADMLGWHHVEQGGNRAVISRHRIAAQTPLRWGAHIEVPDAPPVWLFNAHFAHSPYQPYQLLGIPYDDKPFLASAQAAVHSARVARADQVTAMLGEVDAVYAASGSATTMVVTGDFNEPCVLDWTAAAVGAGLCPMVVEWPTTSMLLAAGFTDTYRAVHPDPVQQPGHTWCTLTEPDDPQDHHDRIDQVMVRGTGATAVASQVVGERAGCADIVVTPYPSDHRALVTTIRLRAD